MKYFVFAIPRINAIDKNMKLEGEDVNKGLNGQ